MSWPDVKLIPQTNKETNLSFTAFSMVLILIKGISSTDLPLTPLLMNFFWVKSFVLPSSSSVFEAVEADGERRLV